MANLKYLFVTTHYQIRISKQFLLTYCAHITRMVVKTTIIENRIKDNYEVDEICQKFNFHGLTVMLNDFYFTACIDLVFQTCDLFSGSQGLKADVKAKKSKSTDITS